MSGLLLSHETVTTALGLVTSLAVETVPGSVGAGVTIVDERGRRSSAATDARVERADALQYERDEGPCLAATALRQVVRVDDLSDDPRWPFWAAEARPLGLRSALSAPMVAGDRALGAMKVYADRPHAFDAHAERLMGLFSAQAAVLVANVQSYERAQRRSDELQQAVRDRDLVSVAKGVLMARHGVDEDAAFGMLLARDTQDALPLREVARTVAGSAVRRRR
nr:GAF and ANTAR domain-containing protein [Petropleomorpha daqingensis]